MQAGLSSLNPNSYKNVLDIASSLAHVDSVNEV